jgi:hypothetical protein
MQGSTRAFLRRAGAACAAAAVLVGGTFAAGAATAASPADPTAAPTTSASATPSATASAAATEAAASGTELPGGLTEALKRDLGMTVEEFKAEGELAAKAADVQAEVSKVDPTAVVSVSGGGITVQTTAAGLAKKAAGTTKVTVKAAAPAQGPVKVEAASVDALFNDYVKTFGARNLLSVAQNVSGNFVIRTGDLKSSATPSPSPRSFARVTPSVTDFAAKYGNVAVEGAKGPAMAHYASGDPFDMVNGQGYYTADGNNAHGGLCSIGWNGFDKTGARAVISAGHCTSDGVTTEAALTNPANENVTTGSYNTASLLTPLGKIGFSQFGGPNNSFTTADASGNPASNIGTDVSVINNIAGNLAQLPAVAKWTGAKSWVPTAPEVISADTVHVTGVSDAVLGAKICKSGRTTGWTCGTVDEKGAYVIQGINAPSPDNPGGNPNDLRAVRGFASINNLVSDHGDSGGPVIAGDTAVGITSAGGTMDDGTTVAITADIKPALAATNGYTIKIFLSTPAVTTKGTVYREATISGTVAGAPTGTTVDVTIDGAKSTAKVAANGTWSVKAPNKFGTFAITAQARNGYSTSASATASIQVIKATLAAPTFSAPALNGSATAPVSAITGTGHVGATVTLSGSVTGTAVVAATGKWSVAVAPALEIGSYTVMARQTLADWNDSPAASSKFKVVPAAPAVSSPTQGQQFPFGQGPVTLSGTNIPGATVKVTINGQQYDATVDGSMWSVTFSQKFASGNYSLSAVQTLNGQASQAGKADFIVLANPTPPATQKPAPTTPGATTPASHAAPGAAGGVDPSNNGGLANTGASGALLPLGAAGSLLVLGGAAFLLFRRRKAAH